MILADGYLHGHYLGAHHCSTCEAPVYVVRVARKMISDLRYRVIALDRHPTKRGYAHRWAIVGDWFASDDINDGLAQFRDHVCPATLRACELLDALPLRPIGTRQTGIRQGAIMITRADIERLQTAVVHDADGDKVGEVRQVYLSHGSQNPEWVTVATGWFGSKETFVPLSQARWDGNVVAVPFQKAKIKDAPRIDPDGTLSAEDEQLLYGYYYDGTGTWAQYDGTARGQAYMPAQPSPEPTAPTDDAMTRSEEQLVAGTRVENAGRARLRKYIVIEQATVQVPVSREEVRLEREPITEANRDAALSGPELTESSHDVTLHREVPVVETRVVPVERVRLGTETVTETQTVTGEVRKEQIDFEGPRTGDARE